VQIFPFLNLRLQTEGLAQVVEYLLCKREAQLQIPVPPKINIIEVGKVLLNLFSLTVMVSNVIKKDDYLVIACPSTKFCENL
jgi:hypothetical protein